MRILYRSIIAGAMALGAMMLCSCATPAPTRSGWLSHHDELKTDGRYSPVYYFDPPGPAKQVTHVVYLQPVLWLAPEGIVKEELRDNLTELYDTRLRKWCLETLPAKVLVVDSVADRNLYEKNLGVDVLTVMPAITQIKRGTGLWRYLVGFGLGDASMVCEARMERSTLDTMDKREAWIYTHSSGMRYGGPNPRTFWVKYCLRYATDLSTRVLAWHLAQRIEAPAVGWWSDGQRID
jgi:hypothetical protein